MIRQFEHWNQHSKWIEEISDKLSHRKAANNMATILDPKDYIELIESAQEMVGDLPFHQLRGVYLPSRNEVLPHIHESMTVVLYMPMDHSSHLCFNDPSQSIPTTEGHAIRIDRGRKHWVEQNMAGPRVTMAVMFTDTGSTSTTTTPSG